MNKEMLRQHLQLCEWQGHESGALIAVPLACTQPDRRPVVERWQGVGRKLGTWRKEDKMAKDIAVVSYNLNSGSSLTQDAIVFRDTLNSNGYSAELVHQWSFNEPNGSYFKSERDWEKYDGIVICGFYGYWNLRELIRSGRPVISANNGFADDLGLGEVLQEHVSEDDFNVVNNTHPITSGAGLSLGALDIGSAVWVDSISTHNHHVDVLVTTLANRAVLAAHKEYPLVYFGWYRMSQASAGSALFDLLVQSANWTFSGP
jgi:hypothetical protein